MAYVFLEQAKEVAINVGDPQTALQAIDQWEANYDFDVWPQRVETLQALIRQTRSPAERSDLLAVAEGMVARAIQCRQYDTAAQLASLAIRLAGRPQSTSTMARLARSRSEIKEFRALHEMYRQCQERLSTDPADPEAHLTVGRFLCFAEGKYEEGLPHLAEGSDAGLRQLAERELAQPVRAQDRRALGDLWYEAAEAASGHQQVQMRLRSRYWYESAFQELSDGAKREIRDRLAVVQLTALEAWHVGGATALELTGTAHVAVPTLHYEGKTPITLEVLVTPYPPALEDDLKAVLSNTYGAGLGLFAGNGYWLFWVHDGTRFQSIRSDSPMTAHAMVHLAGVYDGRSLAFFVNGQLQKRSAVALRHKASPYAFMLGADPASGGTAAEHFFAGRIHAAQITTRARYSRNFALHPTWEADEQTVLRYDMSQESGETILDLSGCQNHGIVVQGKWIRMVQ